MAVQSVQQATNTINAGVGSLAQNYETFLKLLTVQLKNQDPLSPLDNNQFTQQLTQMTGVQQQLLTNQLLTQMLGQNQSDVGSGAINLIGKQVTVESNDAKLSAGSAKWTYDLSGGAKEATVEILDATGKLVATYKKADLDKGANTFSWDGKGTGGGAMPDGVYTMRVTAKDADGRTLSAVGSVTGLASKIQTVNGQLMLSVGDIRAPVGAVTGVETIPTPPPAAAA